MFIEGAPEAGKNPLDEFEIDSTSCSGGVPASDIQARD
jgi:hypothetical protein